MTTPNTDPLVEQIAQALHDQDQENAAAAGVMTDGDNPAVWEWAREWAAAVMPIVDAAVKHGQAEAWDDCAHEADRRWLIGAHSAALLHDANPYRKETP